MEGPRLYLVLNLLFLCCLYNQTEGQNATSENITTVTTTTSTQIPTTTFVVAQRSNMFGLSDTEYSILIIVVCLVVFFCVVVCICWCICWCSCCRKLRHRHVDHVSNSVEHEYYRHKPPREPSEYGYKSSEGTYDDFHRNAQDSDRGRRYHNHGALYRSDRYSASRYGSETSGRYVKSNRKSEDSYTGRSRSYDDNRSRTDDSHSERTYHTRERGDHPDAEPRHVVETREVEQYVAPSESEFPRSEVALPVGQVLYGDSQMVYPQAIATTQTVYPQYVGGVAPYTTSNSGFMSGYVYTS
ncbi:unnamed protein product [Owenia fusiformis]|uniref:Uncharacterized protein n=1 Tax=Owenia fusiformis TaxID=6347 RepID=A0A8J1UYS2_OWEFU|nr:unnamed protein product [Owenia fusiformis]